MLHEIDIDYHLTGRAQEDIHMALDDLVGGTLDKTCLSS